MLASTSRRAEVVRILVLVLLCVATAAGMADRALWDGDEGIHAAMSREMLETGDWLTPRFNGEPFLDKPALFTWVVAVSLRVFGFNELGARFASALAGLGTVLAIYVLGRRAFGPRAGFLGAAILATAGEFAVLSQVVVHDIWLTLFQTLTLVLLYLAIENEARRKTFMVMASAAAGLAVLTKGPVGVVLPALIGLVYLAAVGRLDVLRSLGIVRGIVVFLVVAVPWYVAMSLENPEFLGHFVLKQNVGNFASGEARHHEPFWFYLPALAYGIFPWSFFLPAAFTVLRPKRDTVDGRATAYLVVWAAATMLLFSAASSKLPTYVLPMLPALALLAGAGWDRLLDDPRPALRRAALVGSGLLALIGVAGAIYVRIWPLERAHAKHGVPHEAVNLMGIVMAVGFGLAFLLLLRRRALTSFGATAGTVVALLFVFNYGLAPGIDPMRGSKTIGLRYDERLAPGGEMNFLGDIEGDGDSALFYSGRHGVILEGPAEFEAAFRTPERFYCLVRRRNADRMGALREQAVVVESFGDKVVVSNRPDGR